MRRYKGALFAAMTMTGTLFGILPGCLEDSILRLVTPFLLS